MKLQVAIHNDLSVIIKYFRNGNYKTHRGKLDTIDVQNKFLLLRDETWINLQDIIDLQLD